MCPVSWRDLAACREVDPELFFPPTGDTQAGADAKEVCGGCDVRERCLEWALAANVEHGIWAGLTYHERKALRAERRRQLAA